MNRDPNSEYDAIQDSMDNGNLIHLPSTTIYPTGRSFYEIFGVQPPLFFVQKSLGSGIILYNLTDLVPIKNLICKLVQENSSSLSSEELSVLSLLLEKIEANLDREP